MNKEILSEKIVGKFRVGDVTKNPNSKSTNRFYQCSCECGKTEIVNGTKLNSGQKIMCNDCSKKQKGMENLQKMIGNTYGKLTVVDVLYDIDDSNLYTRSKCICICSCGKKKVICKNNLLSGKVNSCGCYAKELTSNRSMKDYSGIVSERNVKIIRKSDKKRMNLGYGGVFVQIVAMNFWLFQMLLLTGMLHHVGVNMIWLDRLLVI